MISIESKHIKQTVVLTLLLLIRTIIGADQKFAIEPEDVTAVVGSTVVLQCRVVGRQGVLQWTKDDFGLGAHRNLSAFDRYTMIGNDDDGDYSLKIDPVELDDEAKFQCQVSPGPEGKHFRIYFESIISFLFATLQLSILIYLLTIQYFCDKVYIVL